MIKLFSLLVSAVVLLLAAFVENDLADGVYVFQERVSTSNEPGVTISCSIETGNIKGFARLQGHIPTGYKAVAVSSNDAQFISNGQLFKFIWTELPNTPLVKVVYRLIPEGEASTSFSLSAIFSYVSNGKTKNFETDDLLIEPTSPLAEQIQQLKPQVERKIFTVDQEKGVYRVVLRIKNGADDLPSRFVDQLPENYTAALINNAGAAVSFEGRKIRFDWNSFPKESEVEISYRLNKNNSNEAPILEGIFLFGDELEIVQQGEEYQPVTVETTEDERFDRSQVTASLSPLLPTIEEVRDPASININLPTNSIYYKVQVLATRNSPAINNAQLKSYWSIPETIELYEHEGWRKYLTGNFTSYEEARQAKSMLREQINDAFVVAFRNGERIPVSSAISGQKQSD